MTDERVLPDAYTRGAFRVVTGVTSQSWVDPADPLRLDFEYVQRIADLLRLTVLSRPAEERVRIVHLGGGGLTLPRFIAAVRPHTAQIVCEPDADLIAEVRRKLPLPRQSGIKIRDVDGRTGLAAMPEEYADMVIVDAFAGHSVPGELATREFFAEVRRRLRPGECS
ncbi:MAG: fused MFS/spermidine synthase [Micropruina sp.]|nr:fused MFS/spermidine synthase [Micropruina sp.]